MLSVEPDLPDTHKVFLRVKRSESVAQIERADGVSGARFLDTIREVRKQLVEKAMEQTQNNYVEAAKLLGLHPNNLHRLMKNLNLK